MKNLDSPQQNICNNENNDDDEEEEQISDDNDEYDYEEEENDEEEDDDFDDNANDEEEEAQMDGSDDEPDFMDNSGKCWEFGSKIEDEKHLKEWCQNKMGGMIVGKEEKLTRQFHCQIKQCQFKAIFLKSCSTIYTRNKHNHQMENAKDNQRKKSNQRTKTTLEGDYIDRFSRTWTFHAHIGKNIPHDKLHTKFGFGYIRKTDTTINLYCIKTTPDGGRCPYVGLFLKSNGCLYTRGEHEHTKNGKTPQNVGEDYIDFRGQIWKFNKEIGKNVQHEMVRSKFGFTTIATTGIGLNLRCERQNKKCKFAGIYLKSNGCLYTRGEHQHEQILTKNPKPIVGDDYVDMFGKIWKFNKEIGKNVKREIFQTNFGFSQIFINVSSFNLICRKKAINGGRCPFSGIYLKSNGCLYTRGKHEHALAEKNPNPNIGDTYVDHLGKVWPFHSKIGKNISNGIWHKKFGFAEIQVNQKTLNLHCGKEAINGGRCPFSGIYVKANGCLYIRGKHEHK